MKDLARTFMTITGAAGGSRHAARRRSERRGRHGTWATCITVLLVVTWIATFPGTSTAVRHASGGQASLDLETPGCPTTIAQPGSERRTSWEVDASTSVTELADPSNQPYSFDVTVTEGPTRNILLGTGQVLVSNSGDLAGQLSSISVLLEKRVDGGQGDAPGPSGRNWLVLTSAIATESMDCENAGIARTCYGDIQQMEGASLVLMDASNNDIIALSDILPIPMTADNDGDGTRDEDPIDGIDNDGDGQVDEDSPCMDTVAINFSYEFDVTGMGIEGPGDGLSPSPDDLRIDVIATFGSAGSRGGSGASCTVDANCNGVIDGDDLATSSVNESEQRNIRSIQQRLEFERVESAPICTSVNLTSDGAFSGEDGCATVTSSTLDETIAWTGVAGTTSSFVVSGDVSCGPLACATTVQLEASLANEDCEDLISSPGTASFDVSCTSGERPEIMAGDFCTYQFSLWRLYSPLEVLLLTEFDTAFPNGLVIGDPDGPDADSEPAVLFTSGAAVLAYLQASHSGISPLNADLTDPLATPGDIVFRNLVAAKLNVGFEEAGIKACISINCDPSPFAPGTLGSLVFTDAIGDIASIFEPLEGLSYYEVIDLMNTYLLTGDTSGMILGVINAGLIFAASNFQACVLNQGYLEFPPESDGVEIATICIFDHIDGGCDEGNLCAAGYTPFASGTQVFNDPLGETPDVIRFEVLVTSCLQLGETLDFTLNGVLLASQPADPQQTCTCQAQVQLVPVIDSALIASAYNPNGFNVISFQLNGGSGLTFTAWARMVLQVGEPAPADAGVCYATTGKNSMLPGHLMTVDLSSGATTVVGPTGISGSGPNGASHNGVPALAINSSGMMYATNVSPNADLFRIDAATGTAIRVANLGLYFPDALAFNANDELYAVDSMNDLYRVDETTGAVTFISPTGNIRGMAFDPTTGLLWGGGGAGDDAIYRVDVQTGGTIMVGTTGLGGATPGVCFDALGNLFGSKGGGQGPNSLISIDKSTGAGSVVGALGYQAIAELEVYHGAVRQLADEASPIELPRSTVLLSNRPNPFNPTTRIRFDLATDVTVGLRIFDANGRLVRSLLDTPMSAGEHSVTWNGRDANGSPVATGVYFYRLEAGDYRATQSMHLIK